MQTGSSEIVRELRIAARPETIFEFFVDPQKIVRWKGRLASLDPRPGGGFLVDFNGDDIAAGEYVEIDPPNRVVFTWGWKAPGHPIPPGTSTVEVTFTADGDGTLVRFVHSGLPQPAVEEHASGWDHFLPRLQVVAEGGDPGPDRRA